MGTTIALVVTAADWARPGGPEQNRLAGEAADAEALLRMAGWRVVPVERAVPLAQHWPMAGRVGVDAPRGAA
jgi:hypothetical protein